MKIIPILDDREAIQGTKLMVMHIQSPTHPVIENKDAYQKWIPRKPY